MCTDFLIAIETVAGSLSFLNFSPPVITVFLEISKTVPKKNLPGELFKKERFR